MTNEMSTLVIVGLAALGVSAAIVAFLKTPRERRYRGLAPVPLEEQLKSFPESAQVVIIKGNKKRALIKSAPYIFIGVVLVGFSMWSKNTGSPECARLLGVNAAYISLLSFCYGAPISILAVSLLFLGTGIKTVRTGYFPPLDSTVFRDTIAKKGALSIFRGVVILVLPIFSLFVVYLGDNAYTTIAGDKSMYEIAAKLEAKCQ